jgi:hypothetical protein
MLSREGNGPKCKTTAQFRYLYSDKFIVEEYHPTKFIAGDHNLDLYIYSLLIFYSLLMVTEEAT